MASLNIYCDESCHLEHKKITDDNRYMIIGGIMCSKDKSKEIFERIRSIKEDNQLNKTSEVKWTSVTNQKLACYKELVNYFFDITDLSFRCIVIDKTKLDHETYGDHDTFYYKMYWQMLEWFISPLENSYNIYLDRKDTLGQEKIDDLKDVLSNSKYDFNNKIIKKIQEVQSHEIELLQIADILIGAVSYAFRYPEEIGNSEAKKEIVRLVKKRSGLSLKGSSTLGAKRFNVFCWERRCG